MLEDHDVKTLAGPDKRGAGGWAARSVGALRRMLRSRDGAAVIEFAMLALPYFMIVFAIIETFIAYTGQQLVSGAVDTMSRQIRTGNITFNLGRTSNKTRTEFRRLFCNEISILIKCTEEEITTPNKLLLDVRSFSTFAQIPDTIPRNASNDLDASTFGYSPGAAKTINMVRAYYKWDILVDLIRPYITNIRPSGSRPNYFLIVETSAFRIEDYP
jgi:Flp pilus assembly protein TadG